MNPGNDYSGEPRGITRFSRRVIIIWGAKRDIVADISLALGGGGIKGIAHIGVINRLIQAGHSIQAIAGTSVGGLVGAVYAAGFDANEIASILYTMNRGSLFARVSGDGPSLMGLSGLTQVLTNVLGDRSFADLEIPFACTAVDLITGQEVILSQGRVIDAVFATIAVPGIFPPKTIGDAELIDGGVADPVPVALARWLKPRLPVVAVSLSPVPEGWRHLPTTAKALLPSSTPIPTPIIEQFSRLRLAKAFDIFARSMDITSLMLGELRLQMDQPDAIIRPDVYQYSLLDTVQPEVLVKIGEQAAEEKLDAIKEALSWRKNISRRMRRVSPPGKMLPIDAPNGKAKEEPGDAAA